MQSQTSTHVSWSVRGQIQCARWRSEAALPAPAAIELINERLGLEVVYQRLQAGAHLLWQGDFPQGRELLQRLARRFDHLQGRRKRPAGLAPAELFQHHREAQRERAQFLARLLIQLNADYTLPLRRGQDVRQACLEVFGATDESSLLSLRELLALISAHEWRKKGIPVPAIEGRIYPHYGVFSPVRGEYVDLVASAPLPAACERAFDIGVGSGILSAILARRGVKQVIASDQDPRALACATENLQKLGLAATVTLQRTDLFPEGQASLIVCNPPWLPGQPSSPIEYAVYDPASRMLRGFLSGLAAHLLPQGEGWLIMSDLAEHLGLRGRQELLGWIDAAGLRVIERHDTRPRHPKAQDAADTLHAARAAELTSLWRLGRKS